MRATDVIASDPEIDVAYNARATVSTEVFADMMARYAALSTDLPRGVASTRDIRYDNTSEQMLDIHRARDGTALQPAFVFIHGGYWRMLSKHDSAFMAANLAAHGVATVVPDYALAPGARLEEIVRQVRAAITWLYRHGRAHGIDPERIVISGSSAGGHLAAAVLADGWRAQAGLPEDVIKGAMLVSGLFDLEPVQRSFANAWLGLDAARARALSPIHALPAHGPEIVVAWSEHEAAGFKRQSHAFIDAWQQGGRPGKGIEIAGRHHFDIILDWTRPDTAMTRLCLELVRRSAVAAE